MDLASVKQGRRAYSIVLAITLVAACTQNGVGMTVGLVINALIWSMVVWETQCEVARIETSKKSE